LSEEKGVFADDTWSVNDRLSLNLGLRWDNMTARYGEGELYDFPSSPGDISNLKLLRTTSASGNLFDFKDWSPRLGMAYTLTQDRRTILKAHLGRYYAPLGVESLRRFGPDLDKEKQERWMYYLPFNQLDLNHNGKFDPSTELTGAYQMLLTAKPTLDSTTMRNPSWRLNVAPGTKSPYTDQFEVSLQRQLFRDYSIEGTVIYKQSKDFIAFQGYNDMTGEPWQWESNPYTTYTGYKTKVWTIVQKDYNGDGKVDIDDSKFVIDHTARQATNLNSFNGEDVNRRYTGLQLVLNKRYANRWQGLFSANWAKTRGISSRTIDQNWYIDGPMIMDNAFGTSLNDFQNNLSGPSPMTPELMLKANGSYTIPVVEADFGFRWRFDTGRPFWPVENVSSFATWMQGDAPNPATNGIYLTGDTNTRIVAADVSDPSWTPNTSIVDLSLGKTFRAVRNTSINLTLDVLNAFNEGSPNIIGFRQPDYGRVYSITQPRTYRGGVKIMF